ncbi:discoidin domain-containing protein [Pontiellaceae bacterium B12227]|nr:discoidin domain-containing protein [Pontiellaceae bacterium B12227]
MVKLKRIIPALLMLGTTTVFAADITWNGPVDYAGADDVSATGTLVHAVNACGTTSFVSPTVNGVTFVGETALFNGDTDTQVFYGDVEDYQYQLLLGTMDYGSETSFNVGDGLLNSGKEYLVQLWFLDERGSSDARAMVFGDGNGNLSADVNDQFVTGTFFADGSSQTITIAGTISGPHFTAYQVRDLSSAVPTLSTTAGDAVSGSFSVNIGFTESVSGLTAADFSVVNGTASNVGGSGDSWTVEITPVANGDVTVRLPANTVVDTDGHGNLASETLLTTYVPVGTEQPVPTLSTATNIVYGDFTVQVDFNEPVTGLQVGDFEISGGTLSGFSGSGSSYSVVVSPNFGGDAVLGLPRASVVDADDGLPNVAAVELVTAYHVVVSVNTPEELLPYLNQDNVHAALAPGTYTIDASDVQNTFGTPRFEFRGSNSTYDFTDVTINFAADIYTSDLSMNHIQIFGNDNVLKNLTMVDLCDVDGALSLDGGVNLIMDGARNRVEGFHMTIKGSYPYGYGDCFGKGATWTIKHSKHSGFLIRGESNHAKNCTLIQRSYGHCMFMQAAYNPIIEGCYIEGEVRSTDDMLAETSGPAFDIGFETVWGFTLPSGYMKSLTEAGIRAYNAGNTYIDGVWYSRGTRNPTIIDNTIVNARVGVTLTHASGFKYVSGCTAIGTERGYAIGSGVIENCKADVQYGAAFGVDYESDSGVTADITIIPHEGDHYNGSRHVAYILGKNHNLTFRGLENVVDQSLEINVGGDKRIISESDELENFKANDIVINNLSGYPLILDDASTNTTGQSIGTISDAGFNNSFTVRDWSVTTNITFYGEATQSSTAGYNALASLAIDQNTSGEWNEGSVTHTEAEDQPWWKVDLKSSFDISGIRIWNRTDNATGRLSNYDVTVLDENEQPVWTSYQTDAPEPDTTLLPDVNGRYVVIQLRGTDPLTIAEVEIFGALVAGPASLTASTNSGQIVLDWNAVTNATGYTVKRAVLSGGPYSSIGTTAGLSFADTTAYEGIDYFYVVTATVDGSETAPGAEVSAMIGSPPAKFNIGSGDVTASEYQDPNFPTNTIDGNLGTRWSAKGDGQWIRYDLGAEVNVYSLEIAWLNGASRQSSFHLETSSDDATWTALTATQQSSGTTTNLETIILTPTLARYVRIVGHGNTANTWNSITEVEIWGIIPMPPSVPSDLTAVSGDGLISLSWTVSEGATLHHLKRSTVSSNGYTTIANEPGGSHLDTNVVNGTIYYYVVSAGNAAGESADSAEVSAVPSAIINPDEVVIGATGISSDGSEFTLSITNSVPGHNYRVLAADDLADPDWEVVSSTNSGTGDQLAIDLAINPVATNRFYKLETWRQ